MQFNTMVRLGALALNVAQDAKVQELFNLVHNGARRRGLLTPPTASPAPIQVPVPVKPSVPVPIPFAPKATPASPQRPPMTFGGSGVGKYLTVDNAKKFLGFAGIVKDLLVK